MQTHRGGELPDKIMCHRLPGSSIALDNLTTWPTILFCLFVNSSFPSRHGQLFIMKDEKISYVGAPSGSMYFLSRVNPLPQRKINCGNPEQNSNSFV